jgi:hypothetical protein
LLRSQVPPAHMCLMISVPNSLHFTCLAPSIMRAKS